MNISPERANVTNLTNTANIASKQNNQLSMVPEIEKVQNYLITKPIMSQERSKKKQVMSTHNIKPI